MQAPGMSWEERSLSWSFLGPLPMAHHVSGSHWLGLAANVRAWQDAHHSVSPGRIAQLGERQTKGRKAFGSIPDPASDLHPVL